MTNINANPLSFSKEQLSQLNQRHDAAVGSSGSGKSFMDHLSDSVGKVNTMQNTADTMATNIAAGKTENIHETMLAVTKAELSFNLMVQVRNKALEAYNEIMKMPV